MAGNEPQAEFVAFRDGVVTEDCPIFSFEGVHYLAHDHQVGDQLRFVNGKLQKVGGRTHRVEIWRLGADGNPDSEAPWHEFEPRPGVSTETEIARKARGLTKTTTLRFPDAAIIMITVDDGQRLDALEIAFLQTVAVVLHDVENDAVRGGVFRRQADAAEPEPDITDYECIDLVGGPSIDGFEVPIDWCRPVTAWVVCTRFDEAGYPAELFYSVGGPGIGNPVRIDRQPTGEYIVTEG